MSEEKNTVTKPKKRGRPPKVKKLTPEEQQKLDLQQQAVQQTKGVIADAVNLMCFDAANMVANRYGYKVNNACEENPVMREHLRDSLVAAVDSLLPSDSVNDPVMLHVIFLASVLYSNKQEMSEEEKKKYIEENSSKSEG